MEKFGVKSRFPFTQLNQATSSKLEKSNFDMFYKYDCWAVICYPICMTNRSHERWIILLSFPDISFVILPFVFQRFEIKSGFPFFFTHTVYTKQCFMNSRWSDICSGDYCSDHICSAEGDNNIATRQMLRRQLLRRNLLRRLLLRRYCAPAIIAPTVDKMLLRQLLQWQMLRMGWKLLRQLLPK